MIEVTREKERQARGGRLSQSVRHQGTESLLRLKEVIDKDKN